MPIKVVSEINSTEHWTKKHERHKRQQFFTGLFFKKHAKDVKLPCTITMIKLTQRHLDCDNLPTCFKYIRDELSELLVPEKQGFYINAKGRTVKIKGRADSDSRIQWKYEQEKSKLPGIKIEISYESEDS